jgi:hypothetical protein
MRPWTGLSSNDEPGMLSIKRLIAAFKSPPGDPCERRGAASAASCLGAARPAPRTVLDRATTSDCNRDRRCSGRRQGVSLADLSRRRCRRSKKSGATVGETGPEEPDEPVVLRARIYDLVPVRELPYGPAAPSLHQRPDRWQHPTTCQYSSKTGLSRGLRRWVHGLIRESVCLSTAPSEKARRRDRRGFSELSDLHCLWQVSCAWLPQAPRIS